MTPGLAIELIQHAVMLTLLTAAPLLLTALGVGVLVIGRGADGYLVRLGDEIRVRFTQIVWADLHAQPPIRIRGLSSATTTSATRLPSMYSTATNSTAVINPSATGSPQRFLCMPYLRVG